MISVALGPKSWGGGGGGNSSTGERWSCTAVGDIAFDGFFIITGGGGF